MVMQQGLWIRLVAVLAEFAGASGLMLLIIGTLRESWRLSIWGVTASAAAMAATVCAVTMCAASKIVRQRARHHMTSEIEEFLRRQN